MKTQNETDLADAIERGISHTEIVAVDYAGTEEDLLASLEVVCDVDVEIDSTVGNDGAIDVWGCTDEMEDGEMSWRLSVTLR